MSALTPSLSATEWAVWRDVSSWLVHTEDEECASVPRVESNPVAKEKFGEYVSTFHSHNNSAFTGQFQVLVPYCV